MGNASGLGAPMMNEPGTIGRSLQATGASETTPSLGVVTRVRVNGDPIMPDMHGRYLADSSEFVTYDLTVNTVDGVMAIENIPNRYPRPMEGFRVICHPVGAPVNVARCGGVLWCQFIENYYAEVCS